MQTGRTLPGGRFLALCLAGATLGLIGGAKLAAQAPPDVPQEEEDVQEEVTEEQQDPAEASEETEEAEDVDGTQTEPELEPYDSIFYPPDRRTLRRLSQAQELLDQKRFGESARLLGDILEGPEDFFFQPKRNDPVYRSLKSEAQRLIGRLPPQGREAYELQYGARARQMLESAVRSGDATGLAEASRRFFHTQAGYEATFLLGTWEMNRGRPLSAALSFERIAQIPTASKRFEPALSLRAAACWVRAGMPDSARQTLERLQKQMPDVQVQVAGKAEPLFRARGESLAWLERVAGVQAPLRQSPGAEQWTMYRGGPSRNTTSLGSSPLLNRRWAVPVANDPYVEKLLAELRQLYLDQGQSLLPGLHPLAVNDYVFMRSATGLEAIDFRTGKRIWNGAADEQLDQWIESGSAAAVPARGSSPVANWLYQRIWDDAVYGMLSSDGENVYCVEDAGMQLIIAGQPQIVMNNGRMVVPPGGQRSYNRLAAYEIASEGKLVWEIGAQPGEAQLPLAGAFFLGPPLPLAGRLYVLAELKSEVRLFVLDAQTGEPEWSQQLAVLEQSIADDPLRRAAGATPSYCDGVLVCPTSAGAVVAVDLTTRSLLWGYQYPRSVDPLAQQRMFALGGMGGIQSADGSEVDRWQDASVTLAEGRALVTPAESPHLHCLDLLSGNLEWQKPRDDGQYVSCVHNGKVVVVGRRSIRAFQLSDGEPAWPELALPAGSTPSGRGFFNGERYFLPLSTAEVAAIDVERGQIVARSKSRSGTAPGNLICYRGAVISQGVDYVESFYQLEELREQVAAALAAHPDDPEALARQGELLLDEGRFQEAAAHLERSFKLAPLPRTRELLVDALLEGIRLDFTAHRGKVDQIDRLAEQPEQRARFLRLLATGLQEAGEIASAFEAYLRLMDLAPTGSDLQRVENALSVRRDRWVQARLAALIRDAGASDRSRIDQAIEERFEQARSAGNAALAQFISYFGEHPLVDEARHLRAAELEATGQWLEAEQLLLELAASTGSPLGRAAVVRLARLLVEAGRPEDADVYYRQLIGPLADQVCLDGKTGRELAQSLRADGAGSDAAAAWPEGLVRSDKQRGHPLAANRAWALEFRDSPAPFFEQTTVELDQQQSLVGRDALGRERWRVSLRERGPINNFAFNMNANHARAAGHMLLVSLGFELVAVDTLGASGQGGARLLWRQDLTDAMPGVPRHMAFNARGVARPWGMPQIILLNANGRPVGDTGPVTSSLACFQRQRTLTAVDPLTGEALWVRHDVPPGSDVFGDDTMLFVTPPDSSEALVLRALDGQELGRREAPGPERRMLTLGRQVLSWEIVGGKALVKLFDVWDQKALWERTFSADAKAWPLANEAIGVLERGGHFLLLSLADGSAQIDQQVDPEPSLQAIYLVRTPTRDLLITSGLGDNRNAIHVQPVPNPPAGLVINGRVHGFDRQTGQKVFSTPVENQGLMLNQPAGLPVLVFAANVYEQIRQGRGHTPKGRVMCLDKRHGRIVYQDEMSGTLNAVDVVGDAQRHEVVLRTHRSSVKLTFTDEPLPAEPAKEDEDEQAAKSSPSAQAGQAVLRGLGKWARSQLVPGLFGPQDEQGAGDGAAIEDATEESDDVLEEQEVLLQEQEELLEELQDVAEAQEILPDPPD